MPEVLPSVLALSAIAAVALWLTISRGGVPLLAESVEAAGPALERSEAEELIYQYLAQDLPLLVGMRHRAEYRAELKADPPRFDARDRYHFNPPGGLLEFELDGERGALIVRAAIHRYRGRQQALRARTAPRAMLLTGQGPREASVSGSRGTMGKAPGERRPR